MSVKYVLPYTIGDMVKNYEIEDFTDAIVCEGYVFQRERIEHTVNTAAGQCWGEYIDFPAGCWLDGLMQERGGSFCIDDVGQSHIITEIISTQPLKIRTILHIGVEYTTYDDEAISPTPSPHAAQLNCCILNAQVTVGSFSGAEHTLLIPCEYNGFPVRQVDLLELDLGNVETLIISEGVKELAINFSTAEKLSRLHIPDSVHLLCPLDDISRTPWFRSRRPEPIYISDCYCGTPGGGSGGVRSLVIPEGITAIAAAADFHSYWHSIKTPESLRSIGELAFANCHCLEELNLGEGLLRIGRDAFNRCPRLKSLYLPDSLHFLGPGCFTRPDYLQNVSVAREDFEQHFCVHSIIIRGEKGERHVSKCPPFVVSLCDSVRAFPPRGPFTAAGRVYKSTDELALYPIEQFGFEYLDIHGRKCWRIAVRDDCRYGPDGERMLVERWFFKTEEGVTQIEKTADGTVLVRENISIHDVDYAVRNHAAREVFRL